MASIVDAWKICRNGFYSDLESKFDESFNNMAKVQKYNRRQLVAIIEFICSVAAGFNFGFFGVEFLFGNLDFGFRLLVGMIWSLVVALSGMYFLAEKLNEESESTHHLHCE